MTAPAPVVLNEQIKMWLQMQQQQQQQAQQPQSLLAPMDQVMHQVSSLGQSSTGATHGSAKEGRRDSVVSHTRVNEMLFLNYFHFFGKIQWFIVNYSKYVVIIANF